MAGLVLYVAYGWRGAVLARESALSELSEAEERVEQLERRLAMHPARIRSRRLQCIARCRSLTVS